MARRLRRQLAVIVALATAGVAAAGGCATTTPAAGSALTRFYTQRLSWGSCAPFADSSDDKEFYSRALDAECAVLTVPLDYAHPGGADAELAVARVKASVAGQRIGSLVVNPGGPGESGVEQILEWGTTPAARQVGQRFDLVGFDPRGVGGSRPVAQCLSAHETDLERADPAGGFNSAPDVGQDTSPAGVARTEQLAREFAQRCLQRSGRDLLANIGTRDTAKDLDILRAVLGDEKLTYLGYSYGTRLGYTYAEQFPARVRAMVLDGAIDPNQSLIDWYVAQAEGYQKAFNVFAADCATQPQCPLGAHPTTATFTTLVRPLLTKPLPLPDGRALTYRDAIKATISAMYGPRNWPGLVLGLQQLRAGDGQRLMHVADYSAGRQSDGSYDSSSPVYDAVLCTDDDPVTDPARLREINQRFRRLAPFEDDGRGPNPARYACAFWPVPPTSHHHPLTVAGLPPLVVVAVTGDPATPYPAGDHLAKALHARLLSVRGTQHEAAFHGYPCLDTPLTAYLTTLTLPPGDTNCAVPPP
jgi:pimeloyl-ACP methyl ester carboxylesterase